MDIQKIISERKISQSELAKEIGISKQLLNWHKQNPERPWSYRNAKKLLVSIYGEVIKEKLADLLSGENK